jgi:hypothetical protein
MDSNYIKKDGFSNPDTEGFFKKHWNEDLMEATCRARKHCGVCFCAFIFVDSVEDNLWMLCIHEESPYYLETGRFLKPGNRTVLPRGLERRAFRARVGGSQDLRALLVREVPPAFRVSLGPLPESRFPALLRNPRPVLLLPSRQALACGRGAPAGGVSRRGKQEEQGARGGNLGGVRVRARSRVRKASAGEYE